METTMHMKNLKTMEGTEINDNYGVKNKGTYKNGKTPRIKQCVIHKIIWRLLTKVHCNLTSQNTNGTMQSDD